MPSLYDPLRAERLRAVGTRFLRLRPFVATVGVGANSALLLTAAPTYERLVPVALLSWSLVLAFYVEAAVLLRRPLGERWLLGSLVVTAAALGAGCVMTGAMRSPLLPLVFAPVVIAFAAFARGPGVLVISAVAVGLVGLLALDPLGWPTPAPAGPMTLVSMAVSLVLVRIGVVGLSDAFQAAGEGTARMRAALLEDAAARAKEAESMGAKVAHEVRNPLASIKGLVQLLARPMSGRDRERATVVLEEVDRIEGILDGYLAFARPLVDLQLARVELAAVVGDLEALLRGTCDDAGVELVVPPADALRRAGHVIADARRLREALINLARNALAAMPEGGRLEVSLEADATDVALVVTDDGHGMEPATLAKLGTPYFTTRDEGTGLGVTLARGTARQHGGTLTFESQPGRGTRARLRLPREPGA